MPPAFGRRLVVGLACGALLRVVLLPLPGTPDVGIQKAWAYAAAQDVTSVYGVGGTPPERGIMVWGETEAVTAYPPVSLYLMAGVGLLYGSLVPAFPDSALLSVLVKLPALVAELAFVLALAVWGRRLMGETGAAWAMLALWLNPAVMLNGPALGYLDSAMAMPAALALLAAALGRPSLAGLLLALGILVKPQPVMIGPVVLAMVIWHDRSRWRTAVARFVAAGAGAAVLAVLPYVLRGAWPNLVQSLGRLASHDMLSGYGLNVWWLVTWLVRTVNGAPDIGWLAAATSRIEILGIMRLVELGFPNMKPIATAIVLAAIAWSLWRARGRLPLAGAAFLAGWTMLAYFTLAVQVHENHLYLAVPFLVLAGGLDARYRAACWAVSIATAFNMYVFYGIGAGVEPTALRTLTGIDITVPASAINVGLFVWLTRVLRSP